MAKKVLLVVLLIVGVVGFIGALPAAAADGGSPPATTFVAGETVVPVAEQTIALDAGWNLISSYVDPADPDLDVVLAGIVADVGLVKNGDGQVYWPAFGVDQIGSWQVGQGYQVYMLNAATLTISGDLVSPSATPISMQAGWNMIGYLRDMTQLTGEALDTISDQIVIAKDGDGRVYWPAYAIDQIEILRPGDGYQVYLAAADTLLYPDSPPTTSSSLVMYGSISVPGEVDSFVFNAQAGDAFIAGLSLTAGDPSARMRLVDSSGGQLASSTSSYHAEFTHQFSETGEYTIFISHHADSGIFDYSLALHRFNDPSSAVPIAYSDIVGGSIDEPAEMDAFTFNAAAGDAIIAGLSLTAGDPSAYMRLFDAAGNQLDASTSSYHAEFRYNITAAAEYTLLIRHHTGQDSFTYNLSLQKFNDPIGAVDIAYSDIVSGFIVAPAEMDTFTFNAQAGDAIIAGLSLTAGDPSAYMRLFDAAGNQLDASTSSYHAEFRYNILTTAEYTILVRHHTGQDSFTYNLSLQKFNDPVGAVDIAYGDIVSGSIAAPAEMDTYTFNAAAGDAIIAGLSLTAGDPSAYMRLFDAAGNQLDANTSPIHAEFRYSITTAAEYTILVRHHDGQDSFTYNLSVQKFNDPAGAVDIAYGDIVSGSIAAPVEMDAFTFNAQVGDAVIAGLTVTGGSGVAYMRLFDSSGNHLDSSTSSGYGEFSYNITETAEYTILIRPNYGQASFTYNLALQKFNDPAGAVDIAYGDTVSGSIAVPAEMDAFTFNAQAGDGIVAGLTVTGGSGVAYMRLFDSQGNFLDSSTSSGYGEVTYDITETAEYTIFVRHNGGNASFTYDLTLDGGS